ncbi:hypothetical protein ACA910_019563 [Epithemia clementina (nom. ined.)]
MKSAEVNSCRSFSSTLKSQCVLDISRGGAISDVDEDEEEEEEEEDDDEEDEEEDDEPPLALTSQSPSSSASVETTQQMMDEILVVTQKAAATTLQIMGHAVRVVGQALQRSLHAALMEEPSDDSELPTLTRIFKGLGRMVTALLDVQPTTTSSPKLVFSVVAKEQEARDASSKSKKRRQEISDDDGDDADQDNNPSSRTATTTPQQSSLPSTKSPVDFGDYLQKAYHLPEELSTARKALDNPCLVHTGSFSDALAAARSQARLLLVLIPCQKASARHAGDFAALTAFLSTDVAQMAHRKARKSGPKGETSGSFCLWSALPGSPEATVALKRLQLSLVNSQGTKRPIVAVVYAARPNQSNQLIPRVLAQHHASPPPLPDMMAAWMNALRKRHAARYVQMQKEVQELEWHRERQHGYQSSIQSDLKEQERQARESKLAKQRQEQEEQRRAAMEQRRKQLEQALPKEPDATSSSSSTTKTVALRLSTPLTLPDNKKEQRASALQRRFSSDTPLATIFNWVDVVLQVERETVILTTLNGRQAYSWKDVAPDEEEEEEEEDGATTTTTLAHVGSSKMMAFWVKTATEGETKAATADDKNNNTASKKTKSDK